MFGRNKRTTPQQKEKPKTASKASGAARPKLSLLSLESRLMFDAAAAATAAEVNQEQVAQEQAESAVSAESSGEPAAAENESQEVLQAITSYNPGETMKEVVFVDPTVPNYRELLSGIDPNMEVIMLDGGQDGVEQMAAALSGRTGIDAIHLISHGDAGTLQLGTGMLNVDTMSGQYADELATIQQALSEQADILVYGCDFAEGEVGRVAVDLLAEMTGADVQASTDETGHVSLGGDWEFEVQTGTIETSLAVGYDAQMNWAGILGTETVRDTFSVDSYSNNNGTQSWSTSWSETDAGGGGASGGDVRVNSSQLRIDTDTLGNAISRGVNLSGATIATLTFDYTNALLGADRIEVRVSTDGGANYSTLGGGIFSSAANTGSGAASLDLSGYMSANTRIQFIVTGTGGGERLYIDNVQISYQTNEAPTITSNGGGATASVNVAENTNTVTIVAATDANSAQTLSYSIVGSADAAKFAIDSSTGQLSFVSAPNYEAPTDSGGNNVYDVTVQVSDGQGGVDSQVISVTVTDVTNEAPMNTVPGAQTTNEDTNLVFSSANGNQLSITDPDGSGGTYEVTLSVTNGSLSLAGTTGLTFTSGDGTGDSTMTLRGTGANINTALNGLSFAPTGNYSGGAILTLATRDSTLVSLDIDSNLQARYSFSGNANDVAPGTAQNGTLMGNATIVNNATRGQVLSLDGTDDYADLTSHTSTFSSISQGTLSAWVNLTATGERTIFDIGDGAAGQNFVSLFVNNGKVELMVMDGGTVVLDTVSTASVNDGNWHHVAFTVDGSGNQLYIDSVAAARTFNAGSSATATFISSLNNTTNTTIGAYNNGAINGEFHGMLDDVCVYSRALSGSEVVTLAGDLSLTDTDTVAITVNAANDAPTITSLSSDSLSYSEGDGAVVIEQGGNALVADVDSTNLDTGTLTVSIPAGGDSAEDVLSIRNQGTGAGQIGVSGSNVTYGGTTIGTFTGGSSGSNLVITLNSSATPTAVTALVKNITYENTDTNAPTTGARTVRYVLTDGDGGTSSNYDTTITVSGVNDAPVLSVSGTGGVVAGQAYTLNLGATDADGVTISSWTINWGDGTIQTLVGNPSSVTHIYADDLGGMTLNITVAVTDADGTWFDNRLYVPTWAGTDAVHIYEGQSGAFVGTMAPMSDGLDDHIEVIQGPNGNLYISSEQSDSVLEYTTAGVLVRTFVTAGSGGLNGSAGMAFGPDGHLYVASYQGNQVLRYDGSTGAFLGVVVAAGTGGFGVPLGLNFGPDGMLYVVSRANNSIMRFDAETGAYDAGFSGSWPGANLEDFTFGPDGNLYAADGSRVVRLNGSTGAFIDSFVAPGAGGLSYAAGLTFGPDGRLYVSDQNTDAIRMYHGTTGAYLGDYVPAGGGGLDSPAYITFAASHMVTITGVNDAPVLADTALSLTVAEDAGAPSGAVGSLVSALTGGITDVDSGASKGIAITGSNETNGTWYYTTNGGSIWTAVGAVSNTSALLLADNGSTRLYFAPSSDYNGTSTAALTLRAWDQTSGTVGTNVSTASNGGTTAFSSATDAIDVTVSAVNDAPTVTSLSGDSLSYSEGDGAVVIEQGGNALVADVDSINLDTGTLTVSIPAGGDNAEDVLNIRNQGSSAGQIGVSGSTITYGGTTIGTFTGGSSGSNLVITLNSSATPTAVTALVKNITYENTDTNAPTTGARTVRYVLTDGDGGTSANYDTTVTVSGVNDAPTITNDGAGVTASISIAENTTAVTTVTATDVDAGQILTYSIIGGADAAKFTIDSFTGQLSFLSAPNYESPTDSGSNNVYDVTVQVSDGNGGTDTQAIAVAVTNVGDTETLVTSYEPSLASMGDQAYEVKSDQSWGQTFQYDSSSPTYSIDRIGLVLYRASDASAQSITVSILSSWNATVIASGTLSSSSLGTSESWVNVNLTSSAVLTDNATYYIKVESTGGGKVYVGVNDSGTYAGGTLIKNDGASEGSKDMGFRLLSMDAGNSAPAISSDGGGATASVNVAENATTVTTVMTTDPDVGQTLTYSIIGGADAGRFTIDSSTGQLSFLSAPNYESPTDSGGNNIYDVTVQVSDGNGGTDTQAIAVTVTNSNETPTDLSLSANSVAENAANGTVVGTVSGTDPDGGDTKTYSFTDSAGGRFAINSSTGQITVADGSLLNYESATSHSVTVRVTDTGGLTYDETFTINLTDVNETPTGTDATITINEDTPHTFTTANFGFSDVDGGDSLSAVRIDTLPSVGSLTLSGVAVTAGQIVTVADVTAGNLVFTPAADANGTGYASFTFSVRDGNSAYDAASNTLTVNVTAVNDAPIRTAGTVNNLTLSEDAGLASLGLGGVTYSPGDGADESGQTLTYAVTAIPSASVGDVFLADGTTQVTIGSYTLADIQGMQFKPAANASGVTAFQFNVYDSGGTANGGANTISQFILITVTAVNDAPTITSLSGDSLSYNEGDGAVLIEQGANSVVADVDSTNLDTGTLTVSIPSGGDSAEDVLSIRNQGTGAGQIGVSGSNVTYQGVTIGTFTGGSGGSNLVITLNSSATPTVVTALVQNITYENTDTNAPTTGARTVRYVLTDGDGGTSANYDTTVTVSAVNDAPVLTPVGPVFNTSEGAASVAAYVSDLLLTNLTDVDSGAVEGIAIFGISGSGATIEYSLDGTTWLSVGSVSATNALLLRATDQIRIVPDADNSGTLYVDYRGWDQTAGTAGTKVNASVTGGTTAFSSASDQAVANITSVNDAPVITPVAPDVTFVEGGLAQVIDATGTIVDVDSANFDGGVMTVSISANGTVDDRLQVGNFGTGPGQVGLSGSNVTYGGTVIGTVSGGTSGSDPLVITFNTSATPTAVQEVYRSIQFNNISDNPSTATRTLTIGLTDGDSGTATPQNKLVYVQGTNDAPVLTFGEGDKNFTEGALAVMIDALPNVNDLDSANFDTGTLTITISANPSVDDRVELLNTGMGAGQIGVSGTNVYYGGTLIGTQAGGIGAAPFVVTFNATADPSIVGEVMANIRFWVAGDAPSTATRTVEAVLTDGDGGTSLTASKQITVTAVNDAPTITSLGGDSLSYSEGTGAIVIEQGGNALVADVDSTNFDTGTLTVSILAGGDSTEDVLSIRNQGTSAGQIGASGSTITYGGTTIGTFTGGSGGSNLVITLNNNATPTAVTALVQNITYENTDTANPTIGGRTVRYVLTDGDGSTSANYDTTVTVSGVNDAPVNTVPGAQSVAEDIPLSLSGVSVTDVDGNLSTVQLAVGNGTVSVTLQGGATISTGSNGTTSLTLSGSQADINATLATLIYQGTLNYNGTDTLTVTSTDSNSMTDVDTVALTVTAVNDAPTVAVNAGSLVAEGGTDTIDSSELAVTDVDNTAAQLTYSIGTGPVYGRLELATTPGLSATTFTQADIAANRLVYVHDGSETTSDGFTFTVSDEAGGTVGTTTMTLTITPVNDMPTITSDGGASTAAINVAENVSAVTIVTGADVDLPAQALTYNISGGADQARFTINTTTGAMNFSAPPDFEVATDANGDNMYVVQVQVTDSQGASTTQTIQVTVTDVAESVPLPPAPIVQPVLLSPAPPSPTGPGLVPSSPSSPAEPPTDALPQSPVLPDSRSAPAESHPATVLPSPTERLVVIRPEEPRAMIDEAKDSVLFPWIDEARRLLLTGLLGEPTPTAESEPVETSQSVSDLLFSKLDEMTASLEQAMGVSQEQHVMTVRIAALTGTTLSAGFIAWALRSGTLLASFMATMPAWRHFDPLPVLGGSRSERERRRKEAEQDQHAEATEFKGLKHLLDLGLPPDRKP